jgi:iron complex outermembrane receptor protein
MHTPAGPLALGCEGNGERIESSNLGGHDRIRAGVFVEQRIELIKKIFITAGAYAYRYSEWGWRVWPGIDICFNPNSIVAVFGSAGYSFRVPTFTELYYTSPSNSGNPDLRPEEAISYEAGVRAGTGMITGSVGVFARDGTNNIDWIRPAGTVQWHADNIAEITAYGMESECVFHPRRTLPQIPVTRVSIGAASLLTDRQEGAWESKYVLDYLKHQVLLGVHYTLFPGMAQQWNTRYERRKGDRDGHIIVDSRIMYRHGPATFYVEATNITDRSYDDIASVPMPGRWVKAGLTIAIFYGERIERSNL